MSRAVIASNQQVHIKIFVLGHAAEPMHVGNGSSVALNFVEAMTYGQRWQLNRIEFGVLLNVSHLPPRRIENGNVDVNERGEVRD